ncbi:hypothetical protein ACTOV4_10160 [Brucella sp. C7-11G]
MPKQEKRNSMETDVKTQALENLENLRAYYALAAKVADDARIWREFCPDQSAKLFEYRANAQASQAAEKLRQAEATI